MKPHKNKDITEHMAEVLRKHSLPYKEGSWERFKDFEATKRKKVVLWPYLIGAAAMILVTITLFMNNIEEVGSDSSIAKSTITIDEVSGSKVESSEKTITDENLITQSTIIPVEKLAKRKLTANNKVDSKIQSYVKSIDQENAQVDHLLASEQDVPSKESRVLNSKKEETRDLTQPSETQTLVARKPTDSKAPGSPKNENREARNPKSDVFSKQDYAYNEGLESGNKLTNNSVDKWNFSIEVSPNIMENDVNFGGGVGVTYNLSKKLSISSGISYVQLSANRNPNQPAEIAKTSLSSYNYSKSLNEINTSLSGLDIPINLKLNINSNMYASAGISVFNVLNESRYNNFEERVAEMTYSSPVSSPNQKAPEPLVHTVYSQEASAEAPYQGKNFTGFFNFSVGYKLPFLEKLNLAIEPYVKIPVGSLSEQDMDLSNGGLKIITNF